MDYRADIGPVRIASILLSSALIAACAGPGVRTGKPVEFTEARSAPAGEKFPNWPHPPMTTYEEFREFDQSATKVLERGSAGGGVTGAAKLDIEWEGPGLEFDMKVKRAPNGRLDGWNNAPRKELAAYRIQQLFLDPEDFVVPTTGMYCVPMAHWEEDFGPTKPSLPGIDCVVVNLASWLRDVTVPDTLFDEERFLSDPVYARYLGNFNILTYLINQRDGRTGNFLVSKDDSRRMVFAIDNGVTFGAKVYNWFFPWTYSWTKIKVPALPRQSVDRLREIQREDLDVLLVINQMEADENGILRLVPLGPPIDPDEGATVRGTTVQLGLTRSETDAVWERITGLIEAVDSGKMPVF